MGHLLSFIETTPPCAPANPPESPEPLLPPTRSINSSPKSALLVEDDQSLLGLFRGWLEKKGYTVRIAASTEEGLRLFRDFAPFNVVLINYYVPRSTGYRTDCLVPQIHGVELAKTIRDIDPSQGIIIVALDFRTAVEVPRPPELMDIPLLIGPVNGQLCSLLERIEVKRAIKNLTSSELLRLRQVAQFRIRGLGRAARGRDWEDLLNEALYRTLIGAEDTNNGRHWNRKVSFAQHLAGAISSIANVWKKQFKERDTYLMSELLVQDRDGEDYSPVENVAARHLPADQCLIEKDEENQILTMFRDDPDAIHIIWELGKGLRKNEIMARLGLDERKYVATIRRIRLALLAGKEKGKNNGK